MKVNVAQRYAEDFKPVEITIVIESFEELRSLTARCDLAPGKLDALDERRNGTYTNYGQDGFARTSKLHDALFGVYSQLAKERKK